MGLTRFPHGVQAFPNIGGGGNFAGWWGRNVFFVDNEAGTGDGSMDNPYKYLEDAITASASWDTIYVRPRTPDNAGGDPQAITPNTAANWSIPNSKNGIQIIGCGLGRYPSAAAYQTRLQGHASVTGTAPLTVLGSYCNIENLSIKRGGATGVPLVNFYTTSATVSGFANSIHNCRLHMGNGTTTTTGAVHIESNWYDVVSDCFFDRCSRGITIGTSTSVPVGVRITENTFNLVSTSNYGDITSPSDAPLRIMIYANYFDHEIPTLGSARYIHFGTGTAGSGQIANNWFATATLVTATIITPNSVFVGTNFAQLGVLTS